MPSTADTADVLLNLLTDDELVRYGEIARDQARAELERWWVQVALAAGAIASFIWAVARWTSLGLDDAGLGRSVAVAFAVSVALGYWPYRRVKNWSLWHAHVKAVNAERARRKDCAQGTG